MSEDALTPRTRLELEGFEDNYLANYAQRSFQSKGRNFPESISDWRTAFQRDRDRVVHSKAFRRLEYKTQVFLNGSGDHLRTRLTHTIEVAAISRNIARALRLNEDLTETIALAHDLGHSPFGHMGEHTLNKLMKEHGGFEHNIQSLRIVETLESKYPDHPGLNLSWEVREGLLKHTINPEHPNWTSEFNTLCPSLEAQVANVADEITYYSHDLDDGLESGLLIDENLRENVEIWDRICSENKKNAMDLPPERRRYFIIRCLIDFLVKDIVETSIKNIDKSGVDSSNAVRNWPERLVRPSQAVHDMLYQLRKYLFNELYHHPVVKSPNQNSIAMLEELFSFYILQPQELGEGSQKRIHEFNLHRVVCDYLSGMTDGFAIDAYKKHLGKQPLLPFGANFEAP